MTLMNNNYNNKEIRKKNVLIILISKETSTQMSRDF